MLFSCISSEAFAHRHRFNDVNHDWANRWEYNGWYTWSRDRQPRRARHHQRKPRRSQASAPVRHSGGLVTVKTAAGIDIKVNPSFAPKIVAFIADVVASGYHPKQIHCAAHSGHVHGSRHYSGAACDFDQRGWGKTAPAMYHVAALAKKHGLRDGGSFRDWGHIDDGQRLSRTQYAKRRIRTDEPRVAMRPRYPAYAVATPIPQW
jgi:hypothetical protein